MIKSVLCWLKGRHQFVEAGWLLYDGNSKPTRWRCERCGLIKNEEPPRSAERQAIIRAYGLLWRDTEPSDNGMKFKARKSLLAVLTKDEQAEAIQAVHDEYGPVTDAEAMRNLE